jgi:hypothetical protein
MVIFRPYTAQTQASSISQQNSGGNGYIGNQGLQAVGQALGNAAEVGLGIDDATIKKQQAQEANRNKFEAEIERREQEQYIQSQKLSTMSSLFDAERDLLGKSEDLKQKSINDLSQYPQKASVLFDKTMGESLKNIPQSQKEYAQQYIIKQRQKFLFDADDYARKTQIDVNIANVEKIDNHLLERVNVNTESVNQAVLDYNDIVDNSLFGQPEKVKQKLKEDFENKVNKKYLEARINTDPKSLVDELKQKETLTPLEQTALFKGQKTLERERIKSETKFKNDPVQSVFEKGGTVYDAYNAQTDKPENLRKVLSNDRAKELSLKLQNVKSVEEMQSVFDEIISDAPPEFEKNIFNQLERDADLPREYKALLSLDPYTDSQETRYLFDALNSSKQDFNEGFKTVLSSKGYTQNDFETSLNEELAYIQNVELKQGISSEGVADISYTLDLLAKSHYMKHGDIDDAVSFAKQAYLKNYHNDGDELETVDGQPVILPKNQVPDKDIAIDYLENYKENNASQLFFINDSGFSTIDDNVKQDIMDSAYYGLSENGDGLILLSEEGLELLDKNKQPIKILFNQINVEDVKKQKIQDIIQAGQKVLPEDLGQ